MKYTTLNIQGNLLSEDVLQQIEQGDAQGQKAVDFGWEAGTNMRAEIEYAWGRIKYDWKHFHDRVATPNANDPYGTTASRRWMEKFLSSLGYQITSARSSLEGGNQKNYAISHTESQADGLPIHLVGPLDPERTDGNTLDRRSSGGTSRLSPHATVQEYLNVTEHLFGLVSNGYALRLIRDSGRLVKLSYLEFDLRRMLEEDKYSEFTLLYRVLHISRFPKNKNESADCLLELWYKQSIETGNRIRDGLSRAVEKSLLALGRGFVQHPQSMDLRQKLADKRLSDKDYYRQLMRLVYRLLFLMVTEERDLIYDPDDKSEATNRFRRIYQQYYSLARLKRMAENTALFEGGNHDLWPALLQTFDLFSQGGKGKKMGIQPLAGDLFDYSALKDLLNSHISNELLLDCIRNMSSFRDGNGQWVSINYRSLDVEELGSVYEGLLELYPVIHSNAPELYQLWNFEFPESLVNEYRKKSGSYYTRPDLVHELVQSALIPVIEERLKEATSNVGQSKDEAIRKQEKALLKMKVCDPASGSGHMLLAAARTLGWYLARVRSGEESPAPTVYRQALREVIEHCIYAVDFNPEAIELCKLALWLEGHNSGKPLTFLDHRIRNGNSLVGVLDLKVLRRALPDEAFNPVSGDDAVVCRDLKKANAAYRKSRQTNLFALSGQQEEAHQHELASAYHEIEGIAQDSLEAIERIKSKLGSARAKAFHELKACDIYTAAFFKTYHELDDPTNPSSEKLEQYFNAPTQFGRLVGEATKLATEHKFFHWPLEFPEVFEQGGFDVLLGNPPWEIIELKEQEFFATRNTAIANAENKAKRTKLIEALKQSDPELFEEYQFASHGIDATRKFLRESGRNPLTAFGRINMYSVFAENFSQLLKENGRSGLILPTGIATDDSNKDFFGHLVESNRLVSLFDFENREAIFPSVHRSYKFCLLTIAGRDIGKKPAQFGFFLTNIAHLRDEMRIFSLTREDFLRLNPNTKTCPVFRTRVDAELTTKIYKRVPVLINETTGENPWGVSFKQGLFNMSSDSHLFRTREQLEAEGFSLWGNRMKKGEELWLPLYEAKMIWHYDHRFGTYAGVDSRTSTQTPTPTIEQYQDPNYQIMPWYWVKEKLVMEDMENPFLIGFRRITNNTNERTFVSSILPLAGYGDNTFLMLCNLKSTYNSILNSIISSTIFDYFVRQKIAGMNMNFFYVNQLPVLDNLLFEPSLINLILKKVFELLYHSWDMKKYADSIWKDSSEELKQDIELQWKNNQTSTTGNSWNLPDWCEIDPAGCPLPPFKWDEDRRALLKAELDAIYAQLYGLSTDELRYILDPQDVYGPDFPGETFRVLKEKEIRQYGEYRTKRLVMEAWGRLTINNS